MKQCLGKRLEITVNVSHHPDLMQGVCVLLVEPGDTPFDSALFVAFHRLLLGMKAVHRSVKEPAMECKGEPAAMWVCGRPKKNGTYRPDTAMRPAAAASKTRANRVEFMVQGYQSGVAMT